MKELITFRFQMYDKLHCSKSSDTGRFDGKTSDIKGDLENHYFNGWFAFLYDKTTINPEYNETFYKKTSDNFLYNNHLKHFKLDII